MFAETNVVQFPGHRMLADQSLYLHKPSADEAYSPHMCIKTNYFMVQFPGQNSSTITFHHYKSLHVAVQQLHIQGVLWKSSWIQLITCAYVYMKINYFVVQFPGPRVVQTQSLDLANHQWV